MMIYYIPIIGAILCFLSLWLRWRRIGIQPKSTITSGRIEACHKVEIGDSNYYLTIVTFFDQDGKQHLFTSTSKKFRKSLPDGSIISVRYQNANPENAVID